MMPMQMRRKARKMQKVENLYRTATAEKILPLSWNQSDHACAIPAAPAEAARSSPARRNVKM
jgi:hypothetical protein